MPGGIVTGNGTRHRLQEGNLVLRHGSWHARYYADLPSKNGNGEREWRQMSSVLGRQRDYPKRSDILSIFQGFMDEVNDRYVRLHGPDPPFVSYVEEKYFPSTHVQSLSPSTRKEYVNLWNRSLRKAMQDETLHSVRTSAVTNLLETIASERHITKTSSARMKSLLSGVYTFARNHGDFDGENPVIGVRLPHARESEETYAYNLEEELAMLAVLNLREKTAIAIASFAGLAKSEMQGLRWEDRQQQDFRIRRSVWSGIKKGTKTRYRKFPVPIIEPLAEILDEYWKASGQPSEGWLFPNERGKLPVDFNNLYRRNIMGRLQKASLEWHGWHAFRRGLASNLSELGVPDHVIQKILRHGDLGTTQRAYRKTRNKEVRKAMTKLSKKIGKATHGVKRLTRVTRDKQGTGSRGSP